MAPMFNTMVDYFGLASQKSKAMRFLRLRTREFGWAHRNQVDAIQVCSDRTVNLHGLIVYTSRSPDKADQPYRGYVAVYEGSSELFRQGVDQTFGASATEAEIPFQRAVE